MTRVARWFRLGLLVVGALRWLARWLRRSNSTTR